MIERTLKNDVLVSLGQFPAVGIVGSRQVGKTTLAMMIARERPGRAVYLDMERPSDLAKLGDAELYLGSVVDSLVIIDEVQRKPDLFPVIRSLIDEHRRPGRFLILGSASPALLRQSSESLGGRIVYHELKPFDVREVGTSPEAVDRLWNRGGYPESFLAESGTASLKWREAFIQTYLERDIPNLGLHIPAATLRRFWLMLAHCQGQLWNASKIAGSLGVDSKTVRRYLDVLDDTFMVRQLQPLHANLKKRLVKSPKVYLRDSGLLHALFGIQTREQLLGHPAAGVSWEGWCIEQVLAVMPSGTAACFYRTSAGAEIDLILQVPRGGSPIAIEVKFSLDPRPAKGFWSALDDLQPARSFVIYPGTESYPLANNVWALPATQVSRITGTTSPRST
ncbi:MAG: ATPase [Planctomycetes bacterium RBG_13_60_9]|nr:MAG: ATPase [Planctomycetes bacterium RBG_13_60_9]